MALSQKKLQARPRRPEENTMPRLFWSRVQEWGDKPAMREKDFGIWKDISWRKYGEMAKYVGLALHELGLERGDRVSIMSENNPEWLYLDLGAQCVGGISCGVYTTDSPQQVQYVAGHCEAKFFVAENEEQLDKILEVRDNLPALKKIIILDLGGLRNFSDPMTTSFDDLVELGKEVDRRDPELFAKLREVPEPEDVAILIYTSGTTGPPKGAMITHRNVLEAQDALWSMTPAYLTDELLTFLPLCHIAERGMTMLGMLNAGWVCNFAEEMDTVLQDIREISPTIFLAVPRIWEKFYSSLVLRLKDATFTEKLAYKWALAVGQKVSDQKLNGRQASPHWRALFWLAELLVLKNFKRFIGLDQARLCITGAAPIAPDLLRFYHSLGIDMREGYGQTESAGAATFHFPGDTKFGTVGRPLPGIEVKISEEGEILIKGANVFKGYLNDPEKTAETIKDGWLHTGDVGRIDEDGHVIVSDRMKDIIITSGGKNITPSEIENQLKFSPYVNDAVVIGDARKYLTALIMIDDENVMEYAQDHRIPFTTYASLTKEPEIVKLIEREVEEANKKFARVETIKKFTLIDVQLTTDDEEITPTMKLKRKFVNEKFKEVIEAMY